MHIAYHSDLVIPELNRIAVVTLLDDVVLDIIPLNVGQQTTEIGIYRNILNCHTEITVYRMLLKLGSEVERTKIEQTPYESS